MLGFLGDGFAARCQRFEIQGDRFLSILNCLGKCIADGVTARESWNANDVVDFPRRDKDGVTFHVSFLGSSALGAASIDAVERFPVMDWLIAFSHGRQPRATIALETDVKPAD